MADLICSYDDGDGDDDDKVPLHLHFLVGGVKLMKKSRKSHTNI